MIVESRNKSGTLTLGTGTPKSFACQATNVRISPQHEETDDALETLCGDELPAAKKRTDVLGIVAVQDFSDPAGFVAFTWENDLASVPFTWAPNATGPTYAGTVEVLALEVGGDVGVRLTTEAEWNIVGPVVVTYTPAPGKADEPAADDVDVD